MSKTNYLLCVLISTFVFPFMISAQKKELTLNDLIPGGKSYRRFVPRAIKQLKWLDDDTYVFQRGDTLWKESPKGVKEKLVTLLEINELLKLCGQTPTGKIPVISYPLKDKPVLAFRIKKEYILYDYAEKKIYTDYTHVEAWKNFDVSAVTGNVAFTERNNLAIQYPDNSTVEVSNEANPGIVFGQAVHRREFGITKGTFWSPNGESLAFYRKDETMVTDYPLVNINTRYATYEPIKYPMAGMKSHEVSIGVYNLEKKTTVWLRTGKPKEKYLTNITWSPDSKFIYVAELNRAQNEMHLKRYSALTGRLDRDLFTETDTRYVEPQHPPIFVPGHPDQFIWESERDWHNHLYLFNTKGELIRQLTKGDWEVVNLVGFDRKGNELYYQSTAPHPICAYTEGSPMYRYTWKISLKSKNPEPECLNWKMGMHHAQLSPKGDYLIDECSSVNTPRDIDLIQTKEGKVERSLLSASNPFKGYEMPEIITGTIKAADGLTDLHYRLVKPLHLDTLRKYPTIVYVYGGPHAQLVDASFNSGVRGWDIYMASRGYVMFTVDGRGSAHRGHAFESIIHRNLGVNEMADQLKGVDFLKTLPYVDVNRMGVHGWSFGGFMTTNLMCTYPDVFKVGVAGGPVIDWSQYEIMYGERYMDTPQENPKGYAQANLKKKATKLKGHLLLIHGTIDPVVVWQQSLGFIKACVDQHTYPDYFVYPGHEHNVIGKDRPHLYEKITRYFDDYLK